MLSNPKAMKMDINELIKENNAYAERVDKKILGNLTTNGQHPVATVVYCSDSREPIEIIFNQMEPGKLFGVRVAGNVVSDDDIIRGSIEYGVEHLKTPYVIVIGHTKCSAVKGYLDGVKEGYVGKLVGHMHLKSKDWHGAIVENIEQQVGSIMDMEVIKHAIKHHELELYGMLYHIEDGRVDVLYKHGQLE